MTKWEITKNIFNSKVSGKVFTRNEIKMLFLQYKIKYDNSTCMTYVNTLLRAGYLDNSEKGVYRKLRRIPNVSEAYLKKIIKQNRNNR